jgi:HEPN domain-containing protein
MSAPHSRARTVRLWLEKARNDLRNAEHTLTMAAECPFDTICYHAQQCVEKCLKGLLVWHSIDFPKTHDLGALLSLLPSSTP